MNTNQKSLAVLASPYLFGISQVGREMAALASYPIRTSLGTLVKQNKDVEHNPPAGDGQRSTVREDKYCRPNRAYGQNYCGDRIPASRVNRKDRRASAELKLTKAQ